jgi:ribosomal protein L40E
MPATTRCPQCGALTGEGAEWCTQCYADLRPPVPGPAEVPVRDPADVPVRDPAEVPGPAVPARHRVSGADDPPPGWPCPRCGTVNDLAAAACSSCGSGFLADLAADRGFPAVPALTGMPRGLRIGAALVAVVVVLLLLGGVFWLVT